VFAHFGSRSVLSLYEKKFGFPLNTPLTLSGSNLFAWVFNECSTKFKASVECAKVNNQMQLKFI